jgi:hypothetical protein
MSLLLESDYHSVIEVNGSGGGKLWQMGRVKWIMRDPCTPVGKFREAVPFNGPGLTGHGMDGSKLACERPARGPVQPMVRARLRGASHWLDAVGPSPFTAARKRRRERCA